MPTLLDPSRLERLRRACEQAMGMPGIKENRNLILDFLELNSFLRILTKAQLKEQVIKTGKMTIDIPRKKVYVDGKEVAIRGRQFQLLVMLASKPNYVFTKEEISSILYPEAEYYGRPVKKDTIQVTVQRLRKVLEATPSCPTYIRTVSRGYALVVDDKQALDEWTKVSAALHVATM